ncbi:hypothetical protein, partial [Algoriphagus sp. CAU 1675]|uniref:DUF7507 domain-containing protein n=1 Tax=Algoriphagus sp. CAU 1675 TaxID=3032597 RepID=UPI0023DADC8B
EVTNTGDVTLTDVTVTDPLPGLSAITPAPVTLEPGDSQIFTATYTITLADMDAGSVNNTATATGTDPNEDDVTDTDSETITANQDPSIDIVKTASQSAYDEAGDVITYSFEVTNTGDVTLTDVTVTDPLPGLSAITPAPVTLEPGDSQIFTATYTITLADMDAGSVNNTATATGTDPNEDDVTDTDSETITANQDPSIDIVKTADKSSVSAAGEVVTYTFTVTNTGNVTLSNVVIDDALTGSVDLAVTPSTLAPGEVGTATATYTVTQADMDAGEIVNVATATGTAPDETTVNDDDTVTVDVAEAAGIDLLKEADRSSVSAAGEVVTYTFTVTNTGNVTLSNVVIDDALTGSVALAVTPSTLAPGATGTATATYTVLQSDMDAGEIVNVATATGTAPDETTVNDEDTVTVDVAEAASINLVKEADRSSVSAAGEVIEYTFTVTNTGNVTLSNVVIDDALTGSVDLAVTPSTLAPGATGTATATYTVLQSDMDAGEIVNVATATGTAPDETTVNDEGTATVDVAEAAGINLVKEADRSSVSAAGEVVTYTFTVTNTGNVTLSNVVIDDALTGSVALAVSPSTLAPGATGTATA